MSLLWRMAAQDPMRHAKAWADEYVMSPVAHPQVVRLIYQFPPHPRPDSSIESLHDTYSRMMKNVATHHALEWFKAGDDEHHEATYHMTKNYLDAHEDPSWIEDLL